MNSLAKSLASARNCAASRLLLAYASSSGSIPTASSRRLLYWNSLTLQQCRRPMSSTRSLSTTTNNKNNNIQSTNHQNTEAILMPENLYHRIADDTMDSIVEMLSPIEDELEEAEIDYAMGVLNIRLGKAGTWVINKQTPNRQLWWSSPLSGPRRYELFVQSRSSNSGDSDKEEDASDEELSSLSDSGFFEDFGANWYSTRNNAGAIVVGDRLREGQSLQDAMRSEMKTATGIDI